MSPTLTLTPEKACFIMIKAREFDVKVEPGEENPGSNAADDGEAAVLEDRADDSTYAELTGAIDGLNEDEKTDLLALVWIGRGDFAGTEWKLARAEAAGRLAPRLGAYLTGIPMLGDYLEEGLAEIGVSLTDYEMGRL